MITDSFDSKSKPIISLKSFYGPSKHLVDKCIVTFSTQISDYLHSNYKCEEIGVIRSCNGDKAIFAFTLGNEKIAFYVSPLGSTMCSQDLIEANWICGPSKFIIFGSCGVLDPEKVNGKFVIPSSAYRDEGMSYHYAEPSDFIDIKNYKIVENIFKELSIPYVVTKVWTTDAVLMETADLVKKRVSEGCSVVEMELAGAQAVSSFYGFDIFYFLQPGDVLLQDSYLVSELRNANNDIKKLLIGLEIAKRI